MSTALLQSNIAVGTKQTRPDQKSKNFDSTEADSHAMEILNVTIIILGYSAYKYQLFA